MSIQSIARATFVRAASVLILLTCMSGVVAYPQAPSPLPSGSNGIAAKYAGDSGIKSDPNVVFADDFESYSSASQLWGNWDNVYQQQNVVITTNPTDVFSGQRSLQMRVPAQISQFGNGVASHI